MPRIILAAGDRLLLPALFGLALATRVVDLGRRSFWLDELTSLGTAALELPDFLLALTLEANGTLYFWALFLWLRLVGLGADETTIRLLSALMGAAAIPLLYLLGRRLHSPTAGLGAAILLAGHGFHVYLSQEARAYALHGTLVVLSYLALDRALQRRHPTDWIVHGLVTAMAVYSHFYTAFVVLAQAITVLTLRSKRAVFGLTTSGLLMALLLVQLVPHFIQQSPGAKLAHLPPLSLDALKSFAILAGGGSWAALLAYASSIALGTFAAACGARPSSYRNWLLLSWLLVPAGFAFSISLARPIFSDRYLVSMLPAVCLIAAVGLARLPSRTSVAACLILAGVSLGTYWRDFDRYNTEQWRDAAAYVVGGAQDDDGWIFLSKWGQNGFEYYARWNWGRGRDAPYLRGHVFEPFDWSEALAVPKYRGLSSMERLEEFAQFHSRIWLVQSHSYDWVARHDVAAPVQDWLIARGYAATRAQFRGIRVLLYERAVRET